MRRGIALALLLCAGCASRGGGNLLEDSLLGDFRSLFKPAPDTPATEPGLRAYVGYSGEASEGSPPAANR
jgi:hypothetical protein